MQEHSHIYSVNITIYVKIVMPSQTHAGYKHKGWIIQTCRVQGFRDSSRHRRGTSRSLYNQRTTLSYQM